jgi:hypothetical protein
MDIRLEWLQPIRLVDGADQDLIYTCDEADLRNLPQDAGIYVFGRTWADSITPLYIGKAVDLQRRIKRQFNNTRLMKGIEHAPVGERVLLVARLRTGSGQTVDRCLKVVESAYIEYALSQDSELLNKQGTVQKVHTIRGVGRQRSRNPFPPVLRVNAG